MRGLAEEDGRETDKSGGGRECHGLSWNVDVGCLWVDCADLENGDESRGKARKRKEQEGKKEGKRDGGGSG